VDYLTRHRDGEGLIVEKIWGMVPPDTTAVSPAPVNGLNFVRASFHSIHGKIQSSWTLKKGTFTL